MCGWRPGHGDDRRAAELSTGPARQPGRRPPRRRYDPPPRDLVEAVQRLWILGILAMVVVVAAVVLTGPGDLSILARLFIWASTAAFGVFLMREHRRRLPRQQRLAIFAVWAGALVVLLAVLVVSAF